MEVGGTGGEGAEDRAFGEGEEGGGGLQGGGEEGGGRLEDVLGMALLEVAGGDAGQGEEEEERQEGGGETEGVAGAGEEEGDRAQGAEEPEGEEEQVEPFAGGQGQEEGDGSGGGGEGDARGLGREAEVGPDVGVARGQPLGLAVGADGFAKAAVAVQGVAEVVEDGGKGLARVEEGLEGGDGVVEAVFIIGAGGFDEEAGRIGGRRRGGG